jgi:hypothetical protein
MNRDLVTYGLAGAGAGMVLALLIGGLFLPGQSLGYQLIFLAFSVISAGQ